MTPPPPAPAAPRLLFVILAHERPDQVLEQARTLVAAASDATVLIHYDARSPAAEFERLRAETAAAPRLRLVTKRVACRWGSFGLVEAPLNALAEAEAEGLEPDYAVLLSGACLPCLPVASLERYLVENAGREFIEAEDESWVGNGWRDERWRYRFWFDHKTQRPAEWGFFQLQRILGIERRFPEGLEPRFGSQWWALTWDTVRAMLLDMRRDPRRLAFFRSVWIPDEMTIQSYVHALVDPSAIAGFGLTHFQFSNRGKPVVYHDDHVDYVRGLDRFFLRKVSPRAARLRAACLAISGEADDGAPLDAIGAGNADYAVKVQAQTHYPVAGQVFYRDQRSDMTDSVLARLETPYLVLLGPAALTRRLADALPAPAFTVLGEAFAPGQVELGPAGATLGGLGRGDAPLRDLHPALYLARLRARSPGVPALRWSPLDHKELLEAVLRDPRALVLACLPFTGDEVRDRQVLAAVTGTPAAGLVPRPVPGLGDAEAWRAQVDRAGERWVGWLGGTLFYDEEGEGAVVPARIVALPWTLAGPGNAAARREILERSLRRCRFRHLPWFAGVERAASALWERQLQAGGVAPFAPLGAGAEAALRLTPGALAPPAPEPEAPETRAAAAGTAAGRETVPAGGAA